jgi:small GTP-binding protein
VQRRVESQGRERALQMECDALRLENARLKLLRSGDVLGGGSRAGTPTLGLPLPAAAAAGGVPRSRAGSEQSLEPSPASRRSRAGTPPAAPRRQPRPPPPAAMDRGDFETTVKVIVVGNGGVGKSSMTSRYCRGVFTSTYKKTIGVDFLEKTIEVDEHGGETVKLMIWDTAGQEEFDALTASYYRGTGACALVFSTVDRASFDALDGWRSRVAAAATQSAMGVATRKARSRAGMGEGEPPVA